MRQWVKMSSSKRQFLLCALIFSEANLHFGLTSETACWEVFVLIFQNTSVYLPTGF